MTRVVIGVLLTATVAAPAGGALSGLTSELQRIAQGVDGRLGAAVLLVETGETASWHGDGRFPMQSVYKAPIAMAVLHEVDEGRIALDTSVRVEATDLVPAGMHSPLRDRNPAGGVEVPLRELLRLAVEESDGSASDVLLRVLGGKAKAQAYLATLGIENIRIETTEGEMGRDPRAQYRSAASPDEAVRWLARLQEGKGLRPASRDLLLGWMRTTATGPRRIKGLLPAGAEVAHKTGTGRRRDTRTWVTNDIGLVTLPDGRHLAIAVFLADSTAGEEAREGAIAKVARAAWDRVVGARR